MISASKKLELLRCMFSNKPVKYVLEGLESGELVEITNFAWEKALEFGIMDRGARFSKLELARQIRPRRLLDSATNRQEAEAQYHVESICTAARKYV